MLVLLDLLDVALFFLDNIGRDYSFYVEKEVFA